jgi:hypothetical protein
MSVVIGFVKTGEPTRKEDGTRITIGLAATAGF